jgi:cytoskeletal protein RodZ
MGEMNHSVESGGGRGIGERLERRRLERGLTLREVEEATKIRTRYLEGLEREDYTQLPDAVYVRGFLKTYADYLGLDGDAFAREMKEQRAPRRERQMDGYERPRDGGGRDSERPVIQPGGLAGTGRRRISGATIATILAVLVVLAVVIGALYRVGLGAGPGDPESEAASGARNAPASKAATRDAPASGAGSDEAAATAAPATTEEASAGEATEGAATQRGVGTTTGSLNEEIRATVRVTEEGPSWISVTTDGEVADEQIAPVGYERTFTATDRFTIVSGNAGGLEMEINGQDIGSLGQYGEYVEREFTLTEPVE